MASIAAERDGHVQEAVAVDVLDGPTPPPDGASRRRFLRAAAAAGGVLLVGGVVVGERPGTAVSAPSKAQDTEILNFALRLEYLEAAFYEAAAATSVRPAVQRYLEIVTAHEARHVEYLRSLLGSEAIEQPTFDFGDTIADETRLLRAAVALEDIGVTAYNGQAANLTSARLADAAKVVSVDARHAAWVRSLAGMKAAPSAVDTTRTPAQVTKALQRAGLPT